VFSEKEMTEWKDLIYKFLKEIQKGDSQPQPIDYPIPLQQFNEMVVRVDVEKLISGATIAGVRGTRVIWLDKVRIAPQGLKFIEEYEANI
jgi:hypothetical protein